MIGVLSFRGIEIVAEDSGNISVIAPVYLRFNDILDVTDHHRENTTMRRDVVRDMNWTLCLCKRDQVTFNQVDGAFGRIFSVLSARLHIK